jgi:hypothetical protein
MATETSEDYDFMGDGMKDLAMRMGEIDKQLDEIAESEKPKTPEEKNDVVLNNALPVPNFEDSRASIVSDEFLDDEDGESGLAEMQRELEEFEALEASAKAERGALTPPEKTGGRKVEETISVAVLKPSPTSSVGISMKTSKGVTMIVAIAQQGLCASTDLKPGLELLEINGVPIKNAKHARFMIQNAPKNVLIVAAQMVQE